MQTGRRSFLAALAPQIVHMRDAVDRMPRPPVYLPIYQCTVHGDLPFQSTPIFFDGIPEIIRIVRVGDLSGTLAGPVCLYCAVDFLKRSTPPLKQVG